MNYIAEIRAFYDWNTFHSVPADAQALWHALMHLNNKCAMQVQGKWQWRAEFTVANGTLESMLKFSRTQLDRMRNVLIQSGRIGYRKGRGSQSGTYRLIPFDAQYVTQLDTHLDTQLDTQPDTQPAHLCNGLLHNMCTISNSNNNPNDNGDGDDARSQAQHDELSDKPAMGTTPDALFKKYFGKTPTSAEREHCQALLDRSDPDVLETAFHRASTLDNKNLGYVLGIMKNYRTRGIKDIGDIANDDMRHDAGKNRRGGYT